MRLMAQHKRRVVFTLEMLLFGTTTVLDLTLRVTAFVHSLFQHQRQDIQRLLLTPSFIIHLFWIVGFLLLSLIALFDVALRLVYVASTLGVNSAVPQSLPECPRYR